MMLETIKTTYPALTQRDFRYFWFGQCISLLGTWMQATAQQWLVYSLTKSALLLGLLGVAQYGPIMCLSLPAGVFIDRYPKKRLLLFTQVSPMLQAFFMALLIWTEQATYENILMLAFLLGLANTLEQPTRQAMMPELVGRDYIRSAVGLNSAIVNVARMVVPALAAALMVEYGAGLLFFLNGISFIPVLWGLALIQTRPAIVQDHTAKVLQEIRAGLMYAKTNRVLMQGLLSMLIVSVFVMNFSMMAPLYAAEILGEGLDVYGLLLSALGAGSLAAAILAASRAQGSPSLNVLRGSGLAAAALLVAGTFLHHVAAAVVLFSLLGFCCILFITTTLSLVQLHTEDAFRGRVMSIYSFVFLGITPVGNLLTGVLMEWAGAAGGLVACGAAAIIGLLLIEWRTKNKT